MCMRNCKTIKVNKINVKTDKGNVQKFNFNANLITFKNELIQRTYKFILEVTLNRHRCIGDSDTQIMWSVKLAC